MFVVAGVVSPRCQGPPPTMVSVPELPEQESMPTSSGSSQVMGAISWIVDLLLYEEEALAEEEEQKLRRQEATDEERDRDDEQGLNNEVPAPPCAMGTSQLPTRRCQIGLPH